MAQYIDKDALVAEIRKRLLPVIRDKHYDEWEEGQDSERIAILDIINTLEVKEVDLGKEISQFIDANFEKAKIGHKLSLRRTAKHFFELGLSVNNPITAADRGMAEEIIINLKRVEQDYHIDLTKEMEWVRNQVKKGE